MTNCQQYSAYNDNGIFALIALFFILHAATSELLWKPENSWAIKGHPGVNLRCKSSLQYPLKWLIMPPNSSVELLIFSGYRISRKVISYCTVINGEPGKYELNLTATSEAAQKYVCQEPGTEIKASAELIIIESDPECNVTENDRFTIFTCHIFLHGNWAPVMECRNSNSSELIGEQVYVYSSAGGLTSQIIAPTNHSQDPKTFYTCTTKFRIQEKPSDTTANNPLQYSHPWNFTVHTAEHYKGDNYDKRQTTEATGTKVEKEENEKLTIVVGITIASIGLLVLVIVSVKCVYHNKKSVPKEKKDIHIEETSYLQV